MKYSYTVLILAGDRAPLVLDITMLSPTIALPLSIKGQMAAGFTGKIGVDRRLPADTQ